MNSAIEELLVKRQKDLESKIAQLPEQQRLIEQRHERDMLSLKAMEALYNKELADIKKIIKVAKKKRNKNK